jgi:hypothetical protein
VDVGRGQVGTMYSRRETRRNEQCRGVMGEGIPNAIYCVLGL